jgi:hypothetical protein
MKRETLVSYLSTLIIIGQYGNRRIYILKAKANYPQIIKASVMKIVTLLTNLNLKLLEIMINICLFLW